MPGVTSDDLQNSHDPQKIIGLPIATWSGLIPVPTVPGHPLARRGPLQVVDSTPEPAVFHFSTPVHAQTLGMQPGVSAKEDQETK